MCLALRSGSRGRSTRYPSGTFDASMPALAHTNPWWVSQMRVPPRRRTIRRDCGEDRLAQSRVLAGLLGECRRGRTRGDLGEPHDRALRFADHLVRDDKDVARDHALCGGTLGEQAGEVHPDVDLRDAGESAEPHPADAAASRSTNPSSTHNAIVAESPPVRTRVDEIVGGVDVEHQPGCRDHGAVGVGCLRRSKVTGE